MLGPIPHEFVLGGVYFPPLLICWLLAMLATSMTARALNHYQLSAGFFYPPLVYLALIVIYTLIFATFVIGA